MALNSNTPYEQAEPEFIGLIRTKARRYAAKGIGEVDDLVQEGRIHAARIWPTYDETKGPFYKYLGFVLDNEYRGMAQAAFRLKRVPRVWEQGPDGEWERVPQRPLSLDQPWGEGEDPMQMSAEGVQGMTPEDVASWTEEERQVKVFLLTLRARLTGRQRRVLSAIMTPTWALHAMVRNLTGSYNINKRHIAMYLGITYGQVESDAATIRREARALLKEMTRDAR